MDNKSEESVYFIGEKHIGNQSEMDEYYGESIGSAGSFSCSVSDDMSAEAFASEYQSTNETSESEMEPVPKEFGQVAFEARVCEGLHETEACHDAVLSAQYEKAYDKEEAFKKLTTRAFLIPAQKPGEKNKVLEAIVPTEERLRKHLRNLLGTTRMNKTQNIRKAQEKLRDYYGATVSVETMEKIKKIKERYRLEKLQHVDAKALTIEREAKGPGYLAPRVPIKHKRRGFRENEDLEHIPEPDFTRMKNTLWRIQLENYEMVYPVSCEMRRKHKLLKAAETTHLGPGSYYTDEYYTIQQKKKLQLGKGYLNKQTQRFSDKEPTQLQPSATAYGNPYEILEKKNLSGATRTIFETASPFKKLLPENTPDCCYYDPHQSSVDQLLRSRKGLLYPDGVEDKVKLYRKKKDPRGLIKFGYLATAEKNIPESIFTPKGFVDLITDPRRRLYGVFSTVERDAYDGGVHSVRRPRLEYLKFTPGPGSYSLGSSLKHVSTFHKKDEKKEDEKICCTTKTKYEEPANPMYYNERRGFKYLYKNVKGNGALSSFKATDRGIKAERMQFLSERTRPINIPSDEVKEKEQK